MQQIFPVKQDLCSQRSANLDSITEAIIEATTRDLSNSMQKLPMSTVMYDVRAGVQTLGVGKGTDNTADIIL